jgi:hypothetical protein
MFSKHRRSAEVLNDEANLKQQQQNLDRQTDLFNRRVTVQQDFQNAQDNFAAAQAQLVSAKANLELANGEALNYRASGLTLVLAAIFLWNTVYLSRAIQGLKALGLSVGDNLLEHLSPLGWEHINLTGDYIWRQNRRVESGKFRPLRPVLVS